MKAERVLPYVGGEKDLGHASLLKYLGELQTEVHLANPNGWNAAWDGKEVSAAPNYHSNNAKLCNSNRTFQLEPFPTPPVNGAFVTTL